MEMEAVAYIITHSNAVMILEAIFSHLTLRYSLYSARDQWLHLKLMGIYLDPLAGMSIYQKDSPNYLGAMLVRDNKAGTFSIFWCDGGVTKIKK
mmetsp:Transcript_2575/g.3402  ORF Transcript_2575/g.3402 Transcript_2575/m.3402 type:complete len:94 (-) Transcript_2575:271-552(-)